MVAATSLCLNNHRMTLVVHKRFEDSTNPALIFASLETSQLCARFAGHRRNR